MFLDENERKAQLEMCNKTISFLIGQAQKLQIQSTELTPEVRAQAQAISDKINWENLRKHQLNGESGGCGTCG